MDILPLILPISVNFSMKLVGEINSTLDRNGQIVAGDSGHYYLMAETFSHFDFRMKYVEQLAHRQPLYPLLLALPYKLFNGDVFPLALVNVVLLILLLCLIYFSMNKLLNSSVAGLAAILFITSDGLLIHFTTFQLLTEPLFVLLSFSTNVFFLLYLQCKENRYLYSAAGIAGLSYLARPNGLFLSLTLFIVLLGYEIWIALSQRGERLPHLKVVALRYGIFASIVILTTFPSWLPRLSYTGNPIYHGVLSNFMWVDTFEEANVAGPPRYTMQDYFANHNLKDVISRVKFGLKNVFYGADTILQRRWPASLLVIVGLVFGVIVHRAQYFLLTIFMFLQMLPFVWTYLSNPTYRIPYTAMLPFAVIYLAAFFSISIGFLIDLGCRLMKKVVDGVSQSNQNYL